MKYPRIMIAAASSGCGKTTITCALLTVLMRRGKKAVSFKCGPDYIDPMFHEKVLGVPSVNLDTYFTDARTTKYLFARRAAGADISVLEGVMGYYDGLAGVSLKASSFDLADTLDTPVILVVDAKGMSLSVVSQIEGYLTVPDDISGRSGQGGSIRVPGGSHIKGVILNRVSPSVYPALKEMIEKNLPVEVLGYLPYDRDLEFSSRRLGLVMPGEDERTAEKIDRIAKAAEKTIDIERILKLAGGAPDISAKMPDAILSALEGAARCGPVKIAAARDEAFCFYYEDNMRLLRDMGAQLLEFSPLHDKTVPKEAGALLFGGGYPELYAGELSENRQFIESLRSIAVRGRKGAIPLIAECGGFMYLHETMEDDCGDAFEMAGILPGHVRKTGRLVRFGYIELTAVRDNIYGPAGSRIRAHEFHYYDSSDNGSGFRAVKPLGKRSWDCIHADGDTAAGFPHIYLYSNPEYALRLVERARQRYDMI